MAACALELPAAAEARRYKCRHAARVCGAPHTADNLLHGEASPSLQQAWHAARWRHAQRGLRKEWHRACGCTLGSAPPLKRLSGSTAQAHRADTNTWLRPARSLRAQPRQVVQQASSVGWCHAEPLHTVLVWWTVTGRPWGSSIVRCRPW